MTEQMITGINQEEWRSISEYANYQVSNIGRVRNRKKDIILNPSTSNNGYLVINLYNKGIEKSASCIVLSPKDFSKIPKTNQM